MSAAVNLDFDVLADQRSSAFAGGAVALVPQSEPSRLQGRSPLASVTTLLAPADLRSAPPIRLTCRGVVALGAAVAACCATLLWLAARSAPSARSSTPAPTSVTVRAGDTLWSIATRVAPQRDPRSEVGALQHANHLSDVALVPGQVVRVP